MDLSKKVFIAFLAVVFLGFSSVKATAQESMQMVLKDTIYGGLIGGLLGSAIVLLSDNPDDHLGYIPTGAGIGMILGAVYGIATEGYLMQGAAEYEGGKLSFSVPTIKMTKEYDTLTNRVEVIDSIDVVKVRF